MVMFDYIMKCVFYIQLVKDKPLVLFMKGEPSAPMVK